MINMREIKIRKPHKCETCGADLQPGEMAYYYEGRSPRFENTNDSDYDDEIQVGIWYFKAWTCGYSKADKCVARAMDPASGEITGP